VAKAAPKVVIVHDWLTAYGGAERVVLALTDAFPGAPVYTSVYEPEPELKKALKNITVRTSVLQSFPSWLRRFHKWFPVLRVWAFRKLDLSEYDIIISSSSAEAKQVRKTRPDQLHVCYTHTPIRYYWSHYDEYKRRPGFGKLNWFVRILIPIFMPGQRRADYAAAQNVDLFIANSSAVQERIQAYYKKPSTVIHPPVDVKRFQPARTRDDYFVAIGRQMPYKRIDLAVAAATKLGVRLNVYGNGSQHDHLVAIAGPTVKFFTDRSGNASDQAVAEALNHAQGLIFPSNDEDFGITQVEALAAGAPVIAFASGGALDIVDDNVSGILYTAQTVDAVAEAIKKVQQKTFLPGTLQRKAKRFEASLFTTKMRKVVSDAWQKRA